MRLKSEIWAKAYIRACLIGGAQSAVVVRHGDDDAGAIFVRINRLDGTSILYGPAAAGLSAAAEEHTFTLLTGAAGGPDQDVDQRLKRETDFDSDLWIVEVEDRQGRHWLDGWLARDRKAW